MSAREVTFSPFEQGTGERVAHSVDFAAQGSGVVTAPASATVTAYDVTDGALTDVTSTVLPSGTASVAGSVVTAPLLRALTASHDYRLEFAATGADGQIEVLYLIVKATR